ncbi:MAG: hypothetical protein ACOCX2_03665, partial [Armatimonadota bacterium]
RVAKDQGLALNPNKISGLCDRLMCCLLFEHETYCALRREMPSRGDRVITEHGPGIVRSVMLLKEKIEVQLEDGTEVEVKVCDARPWDGKPQPGGPQGGEAGGRGESGEGGRVAEEKQESAESKPPGGRGGRGKPSDTRSSGERSDGTRTREKRSRSGGSRAKGKRSSGRRGGRSGGNGNKDGGKG